MSEVVLKRFFLTVFFVSAFAISFFAATSKVSALGMEADAMCIPARDYACACGMVCKPRGLPGGLNCPCQDTTAGFTTKGVCITALKCQGKTSAGGGGDLGALQQALGITKQIMDLLKGGGGGGGGGGEGAIPPQQFPTTVCPNGYYNVTVQSTDPCAIYNPDPLGTGSSGISDLLLGALGGDTGTTQPTTASPTTTSGNQNPPTQNPIVPTTTASLTGDIRLGENAATIVANLRTGLTEVAGFFGGGGSTFGSTGQSIASRMCVSRPWAGQGLLANLVPDTFFDSVCRRAGYQVGLVIQQTPTMTVTTQPRVTTPIASTTPQQVRVNLIPPEVDIWAEPTSVRLGTRAYIFWNSRGVDTCAATGPNFTQNTISGGASTVSISGPTTYSIECTAPDGTKVTDSVTVNLAI